MTRLWGPGSPRPSWGSNLNAERLEYRREGLVRRYDRKAAIQRGGSEQSVTEEHHGTKFGPRNSTIGKLSAALHTGQEVFSSCLRRRSANVDEKIGWPVSTARTRS